MASKNSPSMHKGAPLPGPSDSVQNSAVTSGAASTDSGSPKHGTESARQDDNRKTYTVTKDILHAGIPRAPGDEVELTDRQAEQLKSTGHIED